MDPLGKRSHDEFCRAQNIFSEDNNRRVNPPQLLEESPLGNLHIEIFLKIIDYLSLNDILSLKQTCSYLENVCYFEMVSVANRTGRRLFISAPFDDPMTKRILNLGLSHLVTHIKLDQCPQKNQSITTILSQFSHLTHLIIRQKVETDIVSFRLRGKKGKMDFYARWVHKIFDFSLNPALRRVTLVLNHEWAKYPTDRSNKNLIVKTSLGTIQLFQPEIRSNKELIFNIDHETRSVKVSSAIRPITFDFSATV